MPRAGRNEEFLTGSGSMCLAFDLELHLALDDHDDLVGVLDEIRPNLTGWIHSETA